MRVGEEVRGWAAGKCLIFDDSFEHEVWHDGDAERIVLICDLWHPQLDVASTVRPMLTDEQVEALDAASAGKHLPLLQRTYSTGDRVQPGAQPRG